MLEPRFRWVLRERVDPTDGLLTAAAAAGFGAQATSLLAARGVASADDLGSFLAAPALGLHDPRLLPDADALLDRIARARVAGERVVVFGDFDADGLSGLAILVLALRALGLAVEPYVPSRLEEGHGLSMAAVEAAERAGAALIVTVDTGSSSVVEIDAASRSGIDVIVTDHHRVPPVPPRAVALVNPHRSDAVYPDRRLSGAGVAFKVAQLLLGAEPDGPGRALDLADLAIIGTVSDVAPVLGENRAIARLGLERMRTSARPGIAAVLARAGIEPATADLETIGFAIAPRLNAAGRVGEALDAARLLLAEDPAEAAELAERLETANLERRDLTKRAVTEAREAAAATREADSAGGGGDAIVVKGPWPVGIVGLVAGRLADETGRPVVVGAELGPLVRASCRSGPGVDLAATLEACSDLLLRHGGHAGAAGFEIAAGRWPAFVERFDSLVAGHVSADPRPPLEADLALPARAVEYALARDLDRLAPFGPGNPVPLVVVLGLTVTRIRAANGGHAQLVLRRDPDVLDGIAFGREDLLATVSEGDRVDVVARLASRTFGGYESLQLEVRDVAPSGWFDVWPGRAGDPAIAAGAGPAPMAATASASDARP
jgi:single-stranded-DNA-specific exonuclease